MKKIIVFLCICLISAVSSGFDFKKSVVKIYVNYQKPNFYRPWQMLSVGTRKGSGCIVNNRVLTNAHVVSNATFIQVRLAGKAKKYIAELEFVAHDCDLALLKVKDKRFFSKTKSLSFGTLPKIGDKLVVYGFPKGGSKITATDGIVSRIERRRYAHSGRSYLLMQTDAAINPGNSGGPAIMDDKLVGVVVQTLSGQNIGYIVPVLLIRRFLDDCKDGKYDGIPDAGVNVQFLENPYFRKYLGVPDDKSGVFIREVLYNGTAYSILKENDVLLKVGKYNIANNGTVLFDDGERYSFYNIFNFKNQGDVLDVEILRNGKILKKKLVLKKTHFLVPRASETYDKRPEYFIFGGLVFTVLNYGYLRTWGSDWAKRAPVRFVNYYYHGRKDNNKKQIVILSKILPSSLSVGYHSVNDKILLKINGVGIKSLKHAYTLINSYKGRFIEFEFADNLKIVLDKKEIEDVNFKILKKYGISLSKFKNFQ